MTKLVKGYQDGSLVFQFALEADEVRVIDMHPKQPKARKEPPVHGP